MVSVYVYPAPAEIAAALAGSLSRDDLAGALYMIAEQLFADEEEAITGLHPGADVVEEGAQQTPVGHTRANVLVCEAELAHEPGKERRQDEVEEMRRAVRESDQRDHGGVAAEAVDRGRGGRSGGHACILARDKLAGWKTPSSFTTRAARSPPSC
jgi:hypothetical protein